MNLDIHDNVVEQLEANTSDTSSDQEEESSVINLDQFSGYVRFRKTNSDLVQIKASNSEILQRIKSFQARKRDEVNEQNIREFCNPLLSGRTIQGCARTDSTVTKRDDCKSHIKVHRVVNKWGPQTRGIDPGSLPHINPRDPGDLLKREREEALADKFCETCGGNVTNNCPDPIDERLTNAELHLKLENPVPRDIYARIKQIENRILNLEGISPEYADSMADTLVPEDGKPMEFKPLNKRGYSKYELKRRLTLLQNDLVLKSIKNEKIMKIKSELNDD